MTVLGIPERSLVALLKGLQFRLGGRLIVFHVLVVLVIVLFRFLHFLHSTRCSNQLWIRYLQFFRVRFRIPDQGRIVDLWLICIIIPFILFTDLIGCKIFLLIFSWWLDNTDYFFLTILDRRIWILCLFLARICLCIQGLPQPRRSLLIVIFLHLDRLIY